MKTVELILKITLASLISALICVYCVQYVQNVKVYNSEPIYKSYGIVADSACSEGVGIVIADSSYSSNGWLTESPMPSGCNTLIKNSVKTPDNVSGDCTMILSNGNIESIAYGYNSHGSFDLENCNEASGQNCIIKGDNKYFYELYGDNYVINNDSLFLDGKLILKIK